MSVLVVLLFILVAVVVIGPFWVESRRPAIGRKERTGQPGQYAKLSRGVTRYRWQGAARGRVLVAVHGLTTPSRVFDRLAPLLGALGYRVLTYDLYGRGLSDAPAGRQDRAFFLDQLHELLDELDLKEHITLMGYSMGGSIASAFAEEHTDRIDRLILLAPAGLGITLTRFEAACVRLPVLGDWLMLAASLRPATVASLGPLRRGFLPAVLSSLRHMLSEDQSETHRTLGREDVPVLAIWGGQDTRIPLTGLGRLAQANRNARQEVIETADHRMPEKAAEEVAETLAEVLTESD